MSLLGNLVTRLVPGARAPDAETYRKLAREIGGYRRSYDGYAPYAGDHEPGDRTPNEARAKIVFDLVVAAEAERTAEIRKLLEREGLSVWAEPDDWTAIGDWLSKTVDGSREPGSDRFSPYIQGYSGRPPTTVGGESTSELRPVLRSIAFDLGLLLGRAMIERRPGGRWVREGELLENGSVLGEPRVAFGDDTAFKAPFATVSTFLKRALLMKLGLVQPDRLRLGDALLAVGESRKVERIDPAGEFVAHLRQYIAENGEPPKRDDIGWLLSEHGLDDLPPLPDDLAALIAAEAR